MPKQLELFPRKLDLRQFIIVASTSLEWDDLPDHPHHAKRYFAGFIKDLWEYADRYLGPPTDLSRIPALEVVFQRAPRSRERTSCYIVDESFDRGLMVIDPEVKVVETGITRVKELYNPIFMELYHAADEWDWDWEEKFD